MTTQISSETVIANARHELARAASDPTIQAELTAVHEQRWAMAEDIRLLRQLSPHLPQLPETKATEVYEAIVEQERRLVAPSLRKADYDRGSASCPDDLAIFGSGPAVLEAQHGTNPVRLESGVREAADHGTSGLAAVLALEGGGLAIIPKGLQSGNANTDPVHRLKDEVRKALSTGGYNGFFSVHGMRPGKIVGLRDPSEIHAVIGLGAQPREASRAAAELLIAQAQDLYGLRVVVGNDVPHLNFAEDPKWDGIAFRDQGNILKLKDGIPKLGRLAATGQHNMATYVNRVTESQPDLRVLQVELSRSLRLTPVDYWVRPDQTATKMGVYMGYLLGKLATDIAGRDTIRQ